MKPNQKSNQQNDVKDTSQKLESSEVPKETQLFLGYVGFVPNGDEYKGMKLQDISVEARNLMVVVTSFLRTVVSEVMKTKEGRDVEKTLISLRSAMKYADEFHQIQSKCELFNVFYPHDVNEEK